MKNALFYAHRALQTVLIIWLMAPELLFNDTTVYDMVLWSSCRVAVCAIDVFICITFFRVICIHPKMFFLDLFFILPLSFFCLYKVFRRIPYSSIDYSWIICMKIVVDFLLIVERFLLCKILLSD